MLFFQADGKLSVHHNIGDKGDTVLMRMYRKEAFIQNQGQVFLSLHFVLSRAEQLIAILYPILQGGIC